MPDIMQLNDFPELMLQYRDQFGDTFSPIMVPDDMAEEVVQMMRDALAGQRGPITDEELEITLPDDAES